MCRFVHLRSHAHSPFAFLGALGVLGGSIQFTNEKSFMLNIMWHRSAQTFSLVCQSSPVRPCSCACDCRNARAACVCSAVGGRPSAVRYIVRTRTSGATA